MASGATLGIIGVLAGTANASPAPAATDAPQAQYESCEITVAPVQPGQVPSRGSLLTSPVISSTCPNQATSGRVHALGSVPATTYPIITFYQNLDFQGYYLRFKGTEPCGPSNGGYPLSDTRPADYGIGDWGITSWQAHSSCWHTSLYYQTNYGSPSYTYAWGTGNSQRVGSGLNDHVWSAYTRYQH